MYLMYDLKPSELWYVKYFLYCSIVTWVTWCIYLFGYFQFNDNKIYVCNIVVP